MSTTILLRCPACPAETVVVRTPTDYPDAVAVEVHCDRHGSVDLEREVPLYLNAAGTVIKRDPNLQEQAL